MAPGENDIFFRRATREWGNTTVNLQKHRSGPRIDRRPSNVLTISVISLSRTSAITFETGLTRLVEG